MLNKDIIKIAEERIQLEIKEQTANALKEIKRSQNEAASRGLGRSGAYLNGITNICAGAIKSRAHLVWQVFFRFLTTTGISYSETLNQELKMLVADHLPEDNNLKGLIKKQCELTGFPNLTTRLEGEFESARKDALAHVGTEIDLFVHSLKKKEEMREKETASTTFNIYSPIGAIQTGDSSIANITQNIDTEVREQLVNILEEISSILTEENVILPYPKGEIIEIIQEGQIELKKEPPNITKLMGMLLTVGTAIQTIASIKPAYEALKQALTFLGISLP